MRIVILFLFLSACVPSGDPYAQIAAGEAALQATQAARSVEMEQTRGALDAMAIEQTRQAGEALAIQAQAQGTQEAIEYQQTEIALQSTRAVSELQATQARATSAAIEIQATQNYLVQYAAAMSTATAVVLERDLAIRAKQRNNDRANAIRWAGVFLLWGMAAISVGLSAMMVHILWLRGVAQAGYLSERNRVMAQRDFGALPSGPAPLPDHGRQEVSDFLFAAANVMGKTSNRLPRYSDMPGYNTSTWTRITDRLVSAGALIKVQGKGSVIRLPYRTIDGLYKAVVSGALPLPSEVYRESVQ